MLEEIRKIIFRPLIYGYSNARVRAMRMTLLSRKQIEEMLRLHSNAAVVEYLSRTPYRDDFAHMPLKITDEERIELAISRNFARTMQKLLKITPKQSKPALFTFLSRYDILNLKTVLLAKKLNKSKEETTPFLLPAGSISLHELLNIFSARSADELYAAIRSTEFGEKFLSSASIRKIPWAQIKAALQYTSADTAKLDLFLSSLDFYYYEKAALLAMPGEPDFGAILYLLRCETDAKNITTAMRLKKTGADKSTIIENMARGGNLSREELQKMAAARDVSEIANIAAAFLSSEIGAEGFSRTVDSYKKDSQLSHFEVAFKKALAKRSLRTLRSSIMSIGTIIGFLLLKEEEMNNIKKIARGKALGISSEKIAEMLVFVS